MPYFINPVEETRCVFLSYDGEVLPCELAAVRYEAHGLLKTRHWTRSVVDMTRLQSVLRTPQLLDFAKALAGQVPRGTRVALVVRPEQVREARLVERAARSNGVFLTYFLDREKAALWVKQAAAAFGQKTQPHPPHERQACLST